MSTAAANAAATAIQNDVNQLATDIATLRGLGDAAVVNAAGQGKNIANEVLPHYNRELFWSEITRVLAGAGLVDLIEYIGIRGNVSDVEANQVISAYGTFWATRNTNATIGLYI